MLPFLEVQRLHYISWLVLLAPTHMDNLQAVLSKNSINWQCAGRGVGLRLLPQGRPAGAGGCSDSDIEASKILLLVWSDAVWWEREREGEIVSQMDACVIVWYLITLVNNASIYVWSTAKACPRKHACCQYCAACCVWIEYVLVGPACLHRVKHGAALMICWSGMCRGLMPILVLL
jgi:hypothetical protein